MNRRDGFWGLVIAVIACGTLGACGSDSSPAGDAAPDTSDTGDSDGSTTTGEAVCAGLAQAMCGSLVACECGDAAVVEACETRVETECLTVAVAELAAMADGTVTVLASDLEGCLEAHRAAGRECRMIEGFENQRLCGRLFKDSADVGEVCASGLGGLHCSASDGLCFPEPTGTTCRRWAESGQGCDEAPCPNWMLCLPGEGEGKLVCGHPRDIGGRCEADIQCRSEHRCDDGQCVAGLAAGETCQRWFDCGAGLTCDPFEERCSSGTPDRQACLTATQCADGLVCLGLSVGLVCVPGEPDSGSDEPGLPGFLEPCVDRCAKGFECAEGPLAGVCSKAVCGYAPTP